MTEFDTVVTFLAVGTCYSIRIFSVSVNSCFEGYSEVCQVYESGNIFVE